MADTNLKIDSLYKRRRVPLGRERAGLLVGLCPKLSPKQGTVSNGVYSTAGRLLHCFHVAIGGGARSTWAWLQRGGVYARSCSIAHAQSFWRLYSSLPQTVHISHKLSTASSGCPAGGANAFLVCTLLTTLRDITAKFGKTRSNINLGHGHYSVV